MQRTVFENNLPKYITVETENGNFSAPYEEGKTYGNSVKITFEAEENGLKVLLEAPEDKVKFVKLRFETKAFKNVRILGDAWERGYGDMEWRGMSARRFCPWYFFAADEKKETLYALGVKVRPAALCMWQMDTAGCTLILDVRNGGNGVELGTRVLKAATILRYRYTDCTAFEGCQDFCSQMCTDPIFPEKPVYGSNNWYYAYGDSSHEEILSDTKYVLNLTKNVSNPPYMVVDDGWQINHRIEEYNGGPWTEGNKKFPDMKKLAEDITDLGAIPGIWFRPLLDEREDFTDEMRLPGGGLDPTHPKVRETVKGDITRISQWGFKLIKHDFSTFDIFQKWGFQMAPYMTGDGWNFYDKSLTSAEVVIQFYTDILESAKPYGTLILGCNTIGHLGAGLMHMNRVGDDTSGKNWERTRSIGVNTLAFRLMQHRTFYDIDADCVGITKAISWDKNKQWADVLARSGTSLFLSAQPGALSEEEIKELNAIMEVASRQEKRAIPLDWMENDCPEIWQDGEEVLQYHWYEEAGIKFINDGERYSTYLCCF